MRIAVILFLVFLITACSNKGQIPKDILPNEKMQAVLWDMINAGEYLSAYVLTKDSIDRVAESSVIYGRALQFNHVTRDEFEKSYAWYRDHPKLMDVLLDSLNRQQSREQPPPGQQSENSKRRIFHLDSTNKKKLPLVEEAK